MSHFKKSSLKTIVSAMMLSAIIPTFSQAASYTDSKHTVREKLTYKASFNDVESAPYRVLDWRNPSTEFTFDMADADWTDGLELLLSADPLGPANAASPILVQFNNGKPIPVYTRGQGFDARIRLDPPRIRPRRNKVTFTYKTPGGENCLSPQHGGWQINFNDSFIVVDARAKSRNYELREIEKHLASGTIAPKTVTLVARGAQSAKLQAMAAQGVGLRMKNLPDFKVSQKIGKARSDFEILLGTRANLHGLISDDAILDSQGPNIMVHEGRPMRLVITGDTEAEVMATAQSFAARRLPNARRAKTSLGEMNLQTPFSIEKSLIDGTEKFTNVGGIYFDKGWGPAPKVVSFDVRDPAASHGEVLLRITRNNNVASHSRLSVNLNGQSLGFTQLDKSRKSIAFDIPAGVLHGTNNQLTLTPDLQPVEASGCKFAANLPGFYLGDGSKITIKTDAASPVTELSRFAATGAPFSIENGADTVVILPSLATKDYAASLKILAKLAQSSGSGWTGADFTRSATDIVDDKHILVIGAKNSLSPSLRQAAPKGLTAALKGQTLDGRGRFSAEVERFASSDTASVMKLYAARQLQNSRIRSGGVAALYPAKSPGKVMGVITNGAGMSFNTAAAQIIQTPHWNRLEGSIARWNASNVLLAQTAKAVPGYAPPKSSSSRVKGFNLPEFDLPEFDMSWARTLLSDTREGLAGLTRASNTDWQTAEAPIATQTKKAAPSPVKNENIVKNNQVQPAPKISVPALRGRYSSVKPASASTDRGAQLRTWIARSFRSMGQTWSDLDVKASIRDMQAKVRPMGHKIKAALSRQADPAVKTVSWGERHMSLPAILLVLVFGAVFLLMGLARPVSRLGGRH